MTEGQSGHGKKASNEDDGATAVYGRLGKGFQHIDGFSHIAYCTGPAQLAYLLSAFEISDITPRDCLVNVTATPNAIDLLRTLPEVCRQVGMKIGDESLLTSSTLKEALSISRNTGHAHHSAFWYCWAGRGREPILRQFRKILPEMVFEYYDGFRSPIVAQEQEKNTFSLSGANCMRDLRQLAEQRLLRPDRYFMLDDGLFTKYASTEVQRKTQYISLRTVQEKIRLVGEILDEIDGEKPLEDSPGVVLLTGMFSERREFASRIAELNMYNDILGVIHSVSRKTPILVKPHPRTSPEKMQGLEDICAEYNAVLHIRQQLVEYMLEKADRHDMSVIGMPSTALLSTIQFGYGRAFCPSQRLMASYVGHAYADDHWMARDHELMESAGVNMFDSLQKLSDLLREARVY